MKQTKASLGFRARKRKHTASMASLSDGLQLVKADHLVLLGIPYLKA